MTPHDDQFDALRHANLRRIGQVVSLPAKADAERLARWQAADVNTNPNRLMRGVRLMKKHKWYAMFTTGAAAAAIAMIVWIGPGAASRASAAMILKQVQQAFGGRMSMTLSDIDMGNIVVSGEIILDRDPAMPDPDADRLYSELHVLMRPEEEGWNEVDAVSVVCQTPEGGWRYCRGNGGSVGLPGAMRDKKYVQPSDYFIPRGSWAKYLDDPLGEFGAMPLAMSFSNGDSTGHYSFRVVERKFLRQLMNFLLTLGEPETAEPILAMLRQRLDAQQASIDPGSDLELRVEGFRDFGPLQVELVTDPPLEVVARSQVYELEIDVPEGKYRGMHSRNPVGLSLSGYGETPDTAALYDVPLPKGSADAIVTALKDVYERVEVLDASGDMLRVRIIGPELPLVDAGKIWVSETLPELLAQISLVIHYDGASRSVISAEFTHVGCEGGRILIEFGKPELDETKLNPARWSRSAADYAAEHGME